jgi:hypothetical protein
MELSFWELDSSWILKFSRCDYKGQTPLHWGVLYINEKLLKHRCLKWVRMTHLDIWNTSYGQKKGHESNWQFDSRPLKVRNRPDSLVCRWCVTCYWKSSWWGLQFWFKPRLNQRSAHKVMRCQSHGSPRTKSHLDEGLTERCKIYYMGEGGGFPWARAVVNLVSLRSLVARPSTKSAPTMH